MLDEVLVKQFFSFPNPVNDTSARLVAASAVLISSLALILQSPVLLAVLTYGFLARVLAGPKIEPWAFVVTEYITPRLKFKHKFCAGPAKRFAQGIGATLSSFAFVSYLNSGWTLWTVVPVFAITIAASLEAGLGFCIGCHIFQFLMKLGVIPQSVCDRCAILRD